MQVLTYHHFPCDAAPILLCDSGTTEEQETDEKREAAGHGNFM